MKARFCLIIMNTKTLLKPIFFLIMLTTAIQAGVVIIDYNSGSVQNQPFISSCTTSAFPNNIYRGSSSAITVNYNNLPYSPNSINVDCGDGTSAIAFNCNGQSGSCQTTCKYNNGGTFYPKAVASGTFCQSAQLSTNQINTNIITPITPISLIPLNAILLYPILIARPVSSQNQCVDGTPEGICSQN